MNQDTSKTNTLDRHSSIIKRWTGDNFRPVNKFYRSQKHKGSASGDEQVFVIYQGEDIVAAVRLVPYLNYFWLRSLYVKSELRGQQLGVQLLNEVHRQLKDPIYCFPYEHLLKFYTDCGYTLLLPQDMPEPLQDLYARYSGKGTAIINMGINISTTC
jgi:GNAT superfamily N-acetyltransferase